MRSKNLTAEPFLREHSWVVRGVLLVTSVASIYLSLLSLGVNPLSDHEVNSFQSFSSVQVNAYALFTLPMCLFLLLFQFSDRALPSGASRLSLLSALGLCSFLLFGFIVPELRVFFTVFVLINIAFIFTFRFNIRFYFPLMATCFAGFVYWFNHRVVLSYSSLLITSFLAYDTLLAWTYLAMDSKKIATLGLSNLQISSYLLFPGFLMRRALVPPFEFLRDTSEAVGFDDSKLVFGACRMILWNLFLALIFLRLAPRLRLELGYELFDLVRALWITYAYTSLSFGWAKLFGYRGVAPFNNFLVSWSPLEFWRRWNIPMRDFMFKIGFVPAVKRTLNVEISFLWTFFLGGVLHFIPYGLMQQAQRFDFILKFWIFGSFTAVFVLAVRSLSLNIDTLHSWNKAAVRVLGWILFWLSFYFVREMVVIINGAVSGAI